MREIENNISSEVCELTREQKQAVLDMIDEIRYERGHCDFDMELEIGLSIKFTVDIDCDTRLAYHDPAGICPDEYDERRNVSIELIAVIWDETGKEEYRFIDPEFEKECNEYLKAS